MRHRKKSPANLRRNQPRDNSSKPENDLKDPAQSNSSRSQDAHSVTNVTEEAVDVLSLMGFKL